MIKHKFIFVDDEENVLKSLERLFQNEGYEIYTASSGQEALKLLDEHEFSLILSDYRMPELNGIDFLKLAKEKSPNTIRMILTGFADVDVAISSINEGEVYKFVEKPWNGENLKVQIKRAVEHYELVKERKELLEKVKKQNEELKEWNINLEKKVEEKTVELKKAYEKLELKVKELEGRDKILQSLLTINAFEDILNLILEVILDIVKFDNIVIYVADKEQKLMSPKIGYLIKNSKKVRLGEKIKNFPTLPIPKLDKDKLVSSVDEYKINKINEYSYLIPIEKENICLGVILIDNSKIKKAVEKDKLKIVAGYASLTALAINDYLVTSNLPDMHDKINEILGEFK